MALKASYYSIDGRIVGQKTSAGRVDYMTDALGNATGTVNAAAKVENTYRYKPYGALLAKTGSDPDPKFTWVGRWGYRQTSRKHSEVYVRSRHYGSSIASWTSLDSIRSMNMYSYSGSNPTSLVDYWGASHTQPPNQITPNCCVDNVPGVFKNGKCVRVPYKFMARDKRLKCYLKRCILCSKDGINGGSGNYVEGGPGSGGLEPQGRGFESVYKAIVETLVTQGSALCGLVLSCIHRCPDAVSLANGCHEAGGHHLAGPFFGLACCVQTRIDLCCLFNDKLKFARKGACRPDLCPTDGSIGDPNLNTGDMIRNWDDPVYVGRGFGTTEGCLDAIIKQYFGVNPLF